MEAQGIALCVVRMEKQFTGNKYKIGDRVRIRCAVDLEGKKFMPMYAYYKVIAIDDDIIHIGIGSIVKHKLLIQNVEPYERSY